MSSDFMMKMLENLERFGNTEITLTFNDKEKIPLLNVCYVNKSFKLTYLNTNDSELHEDLQSAWLAIDQALNNHHQNSSN